ncbi:hypothetical protein [Pseudomonas monteilii]|nr:hypothetical protein [Pseudomonas monteilii]
MPANGTTGSITVTAPDNVYTAVIRLWCSRSQPLLALMSASSSN